VKHTFNSEAVSPTNKNNNEQNKNNYNQSTYNKNSSNSNSGNNNKNRPIKPNSGSGVSKPILLREENSGNINTALEKDKVNTIKKESSNKNVNNETNQLHNNTNNTNNQNEKRKEKIVENINLVPQMHIFPPPENSNTTNTGNIVQQRFIKQKIQSDTNVAQYLNYDKNNDNKRSSNKSLEKISLQNNGNKKNETPLKGNNYNLIS